MLTNKDVFEKIFGTSEIPSKEWWNEEADLKNVLSTLAHNIIQLCLLCMKVR